jgi:hypothetical protein
MGTNDPGRCAVSCVTLRSVARTAQEERRTGIRLIVISVIVLAVMLGLWWLVATTNSEGEHDAELLPLLALIPLLPGAYHLIRARTRPQ